MGRARVFMNERERKRRRTCGSVRLSSLGFVSTCAVVRPLEISLKRPAALMNQALDLGVGKGRRDKLRLCVRGFGKRRLFRPLVMSLDLSKLRD